MAMGSDDRGEERQARKAALNAKWEEDKLLLKQKIAQSAGTSVTEDHRESKGEGVSYSIAAAEAEANREIALFKKDHLAMLEQVREEGVLTPEEHNRMKKDLEDFVESVKIG
jgi:hypothetical protein